MRMYSNIRREELSVLLNLGTDDRAHGSSEGIVNFAGSLQIVSSVQCTACSVSFHDLANLSSPGRDDTGIHTLNMVFMSNGTGSSIFNGLQITLLGLGLHDFSNAASSFINLASGQVLCSGRSGRYSVSSAMNLVQVTFKSTLFMNFSDLLSSSTHHTSGDDFAGRMDSGGSQRLVNFLQIARPC